MKLVIIVTAVAVVVTATDVVIIVVAVTAAGTMAIFLISIRLLDVLHRGLTGTSSILI